MITSPVLIIGCPRSGTTLLYRTLSAASGLWSIGGESKRIIERYHHPAAKNWQSGALSATDLTAESRAYMLARFERQAAPGAYWRAFGQARVRLAANQWWQGVKSRGRRTGRAAKASSALPEAGLGMAQRVGQTVGAADRLVRLRRPHNIRLLEKTPENCLRLPFLQALFPDARVIYLHRHPYGNISSLMDGWREPHLFPGYRVPLDVSIPNLSRNRWAFTLIAGWDTLVDRPLAEVCARQWAKSNSAVLDYLNTPSALPSIRVSYEALTSDPTRELARLATFLNLDGQRLKLPDIPVNAVSKPDPAKWERNAAEIDAVTALFGPVSTRLGYGAEPGAAPSNSA